ncbi:hypothetical protein [Streptantibioticus ferralitis]|uniref:Uncharacterized protein n=1 Tax=Streptantibioticus ferralitis TaxID=236510 RepID=A0ABT5ZAH2_9ACTN|nr:hypothetical protein [Streptantibioticus ferralitis]MDF2260824.1 hypothetical protein [Streptantibioticus ferralitis]
MSEIEELRRRLDALEAEVGLREQAANTHALVALNDRDVAEPRAHRQVLGALRETRLEQGQQIQALDAKAGALDTEMRRGFATVLTAVQAIADRLDDRPGGRA